MNELYKQCLESGLDISYKGKVFLGKYSHNGILVARTGYQVHMEGHKPFSRFYKNINDAIAKFAELRKQC